MPNDQTATPKSKLRWFNPTPSRLLVILLVVEAVLLLSERFKWFLFNGHKGWTVLIAVAVVGLFLLLMLLWFIVSLIFRWHFQFSIRSLLVLTVAVAIPFSWLAMEMKWAREQKAAGEMLTKDEGWVQYDDEYDESLCPPALRWMREHLGHDFFNNVYGVEFSETKATDTELVYLRSLTQLRLLFIYNTTVTDAGLEHIKGLTQLLLLVLKNTNVTDAGLEHLKGLTQLQRLDIRYTKVTDDGVRKLQKALPNCKIFH
jgi:hypothetical protein